MAMEEEREIETQIKQQQTTIHLSEPQIAAMIQRKGQESHEREWVTAWTPCFDVTRPGPDLHDTTNQWYESPFAIEIPDHLTHASKVRGIRQHELIKAIGFDKDTRGRMIQQPPETNTDQMRRTPPKELLTAAIIGLYDAERRTTKETKENDGIIISCNEDEGVDEELRQALRVMLAEEFHQTTTIPLPTTAQWQDATERDKDMRIIRDAIRNNTEIQPQQINEAALYKLWCQGRIEEEEGILYHNLHKDKARHVRTKIPPPSIRQAIFSALHAAPMAGHTGYQKTYWKIAARYYWPGMAADIKQLTLGCGHCNAANATSHEAQQQLQTFQADEPFDVITLDVWHPGKAATTKKGTGTHVVTCIDAMTGFAAATFVDALDSETMTRAAFTAFFITHGLPRLVIIDSGSEFAGAMQALCQNIGIPHYTVSKGNHKAIICERFHRYLNKVQRIHAADCETFQEFMFGTIFAVYAWNSAPVDGTDVVRSYAAIGREFPFPIDFERDSIVPREHEAQGQQTIEHVNSTFPLLRQQQELLKILVDDRREHHRMLKNEGRKMKTFAPGDLVIVKKQVQTSQEKGPAKARMTTRGPYRVIEQVKPGTYRVQRLPGIQGAGRRGKIVKESAARLTKIPSTLVIHKPTAGIDTRLATYRHAMVDNPLETVLGLYEPGRYQQANPERPFAYDRIEDLWQETVESDNDEDASSDSDSTVDDSSDDDDDRREKQHDNETDAPMPQQASTPNQATNQRDHDQNKARNQSKKTRTQEPHLRNHNKPRTQEPHLRNHNKARNGRNPQKQQQSDEHRDEKQNDQQDTEITMCQDPTTQLNKHNKSEHTSYTNKSGNQEIECSSSNTQSTLLTHRDGLQYKPNLKTTIQHECETKDNTVYGFTSESRQIVKPENNETVATGQKYINYDRTEPSDR